jgi:hypothetical protein
MIIGPPLTYNSGATFGSNTLHHLSTLRIDENFGQHISRKYQSNEFGIIHKTIKLVKVLGSIPRKDRLNLMIAV